MTLRPNLDPRSDPYATLREQFFVPRCSPFAFAATVEQIQLFRSATLDVHFWQNLPGGNSKRIFSKAPQLEASERLL